MPNTLEKIYGISPGVQSGEILIPAFQYKRMPAEQKIYFVPVATAGMSLMYKFVYGDLKIEYMVRERVDETDNVEFATLVRRFIEAVKEPVSLVEGDEDQEFTYGALCVALATVKLPEMDWLLEHQFGDYYSLKNIGDIK